jgi:hypothetical protein
MALVFAVNFVLATLAVRVVILKVRAGGDGAVVAATRRAVLALAGLSVAAVGMAWAYQLLPGATLLALVPGVVVATQLALRPPPPSRLRAVGWRLMATSLTTAAILILGL